LGETVVYLSQDGVLLLDVQVCRQVWQFSLLLGNVIRGWASEELMRAVELVSV
jgi:hypothetical protein